MTVGTLAGEITRFEDLSALEGRLPKSSSKRKKSVPKKKFKKKKGTVCQKTNVILFEPVSEIVYDRNTEHKSLGKFSRSFFSSLSAVYSA